MKSNIVLLNENAIVTTYTMIELYRDLDRQIKALTKQKDVIGDELKSGYFLDHDEFIHDGRLLATYYASHPVRLDQKRLKAEQPKLYQQYEIITEERRFLLK